MCGFKSLWGRLEKKMEEEKILDVILSQREEISLTKMMELLQKKIDEEKAKSAREAIEATEAAEEIIQRQEEHLHDVKEQLEEAGMEDHMRLEKVEANHNPENQIIVGGVIEPEPEALYGSEEVYVTEEPVTETPEQETPEQETPEADPTRRTAYAYLDGKPLKLQKAEENWSQKAEELLKANWSDEQGPPETETPPWPRGLSTQEIIQQQLQARPMAAQVGTAPTPNGGGINVLSEKKKITPLPVAVAASQLPFSKKNLPARDKNSIAETIAKKLGIKIESLTDKAKAAEEAAKYLAENRAEIEATREKREKKKADEAMAKSSPLVQVMVKKRIDRENEYAQIKIGKVIKRRELLGNEFVEGKVRVTNELNGKSLLKTPNVDIVVYPPQYRTIQTRDRICRIPLPWVAFCHLSYDRNNTKKQRKGIRTGTIQERRNIAVSHHLFVGFAGQPLEDMNGIVYPPQIPHVHNDFTICMGPIPVDGNFKARRTYDQREDTSTEDLIDAFWNNRFVYEERGPLRFAQWEKIPLDKILERNWAHGQGTPLHRFPPNIRQYEDFFER